MAVNVMNPKNRGLSGSPWSLLQGLLFSLSLRTFSGQFQHWRYVPGPASGSLLLWPSGSLSTPCTGPSTREPEVILGSDVGLVALVSWGDLSRHVG